MWLSQTINAVKELKINTFAQFAINSDKKVVDKESMVNEWEW
jgi:hypothetical protein